MMSAMMSRYVVLCSLNGNNHPDPTISGHGKFNIYCFRLALFYFYYSFIAKQIVTAFYNVTIKIELFFANGSEGASL